MSRLTSKCSNSILFLFLLLGLDVLLEIGDLRIFVGQFSLQKTDIKTVIIFSKSQAHNKLYTWHLGANADCFFSNDILSPKHTTSYILGTWGLMHIGSIQGYQVLLHEPNHVND